MRELKVVSVSPAGLVQIGLALAGGTGGAGLLTGLGFCLLGPAGGGVGFLLGSGGGVQGGLALSQVIQNRKG